MALSSLPTDSFAAYTMNRSDAEHKKLKILFVGDASSYHQNLGEALRQLGHEVTVASHGGHWLNTGHDIYTGRRWKNKLGGLELWARLNLGLKQKLRGYDVVSIATQSFIELKPSRQKAIYDYLRANNRSMFYTALGTDSNYVAECLDPESPLRYSEFRIFGKETPLTLAQPNLISEWLSDEMVALNRYIYDTVDGAVSVLYENEVALHRCLPPEKIAYAGIPINLSEFEPVELPDRIGKVCLFLGRYRGRYLEKGTDVMEAAAKAVVERYPGKAELIIVENRPYREYLDLLRSGHVVLDQLYSYTPATNALQAMAYGLNTVSGGAPEYYDFIGETSLKPVIHVEPDYESVYRALEQTVLHPEEIRPRGLAGREFVRKHNDHLLVAKRYLDFWHRRLTQKGGTDEQP